MYTYIPIQSYNLVEMHRLYFEYSHTELHNLCT
jgi:hypothetical protein